MTRKLLNNKGDSEAAAFTIQLTDPLADVQGGIATARLLHMLVDEGRLAGLQHLSVVRLQCVGVFGPDPGGAWATRTPKNPN